MAEWRLFDPAEGAPTCTTATWYATREHAPHAEQPAHKPRLNAALELVMQVTADDGSQTISDLGAGDGGLLQAIQAADPDAIVWGYDLMPSNLWMAQQRGVTVALADVLQDPIVYGSCTIMTEFLEHLVDPHGLLLRLHNDDQIDWLVCSSPRNETDQHHYEHHLWAWDEEGYAKMFTDAGWRVVAQPTVGDFQLILAAR